MNPKLAEFSNETIIALGRKAFNDELHSFRVCVFRGFYARIVSRQFVGGRYL